ncbi:MAG TPA: alkaline phosphatase family protein [Chroococcales cyanobacterium]
MNLDPFIPHQSRFSACSLFLVAAILASGRVAEAFPAVSDAPFLYKPPGPAELVRVKKAFRDAAARSAGERSGQIFVLPNKYNYIMDKGFGAPPFTHLKGVKTEAHGTVHGVSWEYDTHLPLVLWGPGFVRAGARFEKPATQQDLVPTYARLMGAVPPDDARGRVLEEALLGKAKHPKVVLTVLFDQAGEVYYRAHPGKTPNVDRLKREGSSFSNALVTDLDAETGIGHVAVGTGAWPAQTGISSNNFWMRGFGSKRYSFKGETDSSPIFLNSPTLADVWLRQTKNQALVASYCYADRAAIGMAGHGALFKGNKKPWVIFYDERLGQLTTNEDFFELPEYLRGLGPKPYLDALTKGTGIWMEHFIDPKATVRYTPAYPAFDGDNVLSLIQHEPFGADEITDLIFVTLKSTDTAGHAFGHESDEAGAVLAEQDKQFGRIVEALVSKVGRNNVLVALSADHGSTPLSELSGGVRLSDQQLLDDLNKKADHLANGVNLFEGATATQLYVNEAERRRNHVGLETLKQIVLDYRVHGKAFFADAVTCEEAVRDARKFRGD